MPLIAWGALPHDKKAISGRVGAPWQFLQSLQNAHWAQDVQKLQRGKHLKYVKNFQPEEVSLLCQKSPLGLTKLVKLIENQ